MFLSNFHTLTVSIKNNSKKKIPLKLFSLTDPVDENLEVTVAESSYDFLLKTCVGHSHKVNGIKVMTNKIEQIESHATVKSETAYGNIITFPSIFLTEDFVKQKDGSHIGDVKDLQMEINGLMTYEIDVVGEGEMEITFFLDGAYLRKNDETTLCVTIINDSEKKKKVPIFQSPSEEWIEGIKYESVASYMELLMELEHYSYYIDHVRVYCQNPEQFKHPIYLPDRTGNEFKVTDPESRPFFASTGKLTYYTDQENPLEVEVERMTKVIYMFRSPSRKIIPYQELAKPLA